MTRLGMRSDASLPTQDISDADHEDDQQADG